MVGAADGVLVVLYHQQGVALVAQVLQRVDQDVVVTRVQADGGFVQHIADALQIAAQLRRQPDALRLATAQRRRAAVQRQIAQAHLLQKGQAAADFRHDVARNLGFAAAEFQSVHPGRHIRHAQRRHIGNADAMQAYVARNRVQARAVAGGTGLVAHAFHLGLGEGLLAPLVVLVGDGVVQRLALLLAQFHTGTHAIRAPAVLAVVAEQARIEFLVAGAAYRAGAQRGIHLHAANAGAGASLCHGFGQPIQRAHHVHYALAVAQRIAHAFTQLQFVFRRDVQAQHRQRDVVFLETIQTRKTVGRQKFAIHTQMRMPARARPVGQLGIDALASAHQRCQQANVLAAMLAQDLRHDPVGRLRLDGRIVMHAVLDAQLDVQQAQEVPDFRRGAHGRLAPATAQALLDRHRGRNAVHRVHLGPARRLHHAACVGVQAFQIATLALVEDDVERQRGFAGTAHAGDDVELAARDLHGEVLEVVFVGVDDFDGVAAALGGKQRGG